MTTPLRLPTALVLRSKHSTLCNSRTLTLRSIFVKHCASFAMKPILCGSAAWLVLPWVIMDVKAARGPRADPRKCPAGAGQILVVRLIAVFKLVELRRNASSTPLV